MDREKVIKGLDVCLKNIDRPDCPNDCPYLSDCLKYENRVVFQPLMRDAIALLKEQEPLEPTRVEIDQAGPLYHRCYCKKCGHHVGNMIKNKVTEAHENFCSKCGQEVNWK